MVVGRVADVPEAAEILVLFGRALSHFRVGVTLCDEPGSDARRYLADAAPLQPVEADAVELLLPRFYRYSDLHVPISATKGLWRPV
jgi:hypothetical protein